MRLFASVDGKINRLDRCMLYGDLFDLALSTEVWIAGDDLKSAKMSLVGSMYRASSLASTVYPVTTDRCATYSILTGAEP
jgi:hypothetical protein